MHLDNPNYETLLKNHSHLNGVQINDVDVKPHLAVHVVLGASEYAAIKMKTAPRIGSPGQPIAEKTLLGWTIMSPGREEFHSSPVWVDLLSIPVGWGHQSTSHIMGRSVPRVCRGNT